MNTTFLLMAQYGKAHIPLDVVAEDYLGMTSVRARQMAKAGKLPVPAFRVAKSQKSAWLVNTADLADYLDRQREVAKSDWVQQKGHTK